MASDQTLEEFIVSQLSSLNLKSDDETVEFVQGLVEEDSFLPEDRKSAILGVLEMDEEDETSSNAIDSLLEATQAYQDEAAARRKAEEEAKAPPKPEENESKKKVLTPEEEERRKAEFIRQYGQVAEGEDEDEDVIPDKALVDPSKLSKKQRKKAFDGVDLLALPNMNKAHVKNAEQARRNQDAAKSQAKKEKDKADRKKQLDDAAKKLADKQKKAQKVERKA